VETCGELAVWRELANFWLLIHRRTISAGAEREHKPCWWFRRRGTSRMLKKIGHTVALDRQRSQQRIKLDKVHKIEKNHQMKHLLSALGDVFRALHFRPLVEREATPCEE